MHARHLSGNRSSGLHHGHASDRAPHRDRQQRHRLGSRGALDLGAARSRERLERHRIQLPDRSKRSTVRGARRRRRSDGRALLVRQRRHDGGRGPGHVFLRAIARCRQCDAGVVAGVAGRQVEPGSQRKKPARRQRVNAGRDQRSSRRELVGPRLRRHLVPRQRPLPAPAGTAAGGCATSGGRVSGEPDRAPPMCFRRRGTVPGAGHHPCRLRLASFYKRELDFGELDSGDIYVHGGEFECRCQ